MENLISSIRPIEIRYVMPKNGDEKAQQIFFKMQDASSYLLIDLSLMKRSHPDRFMEREIHGVLARLIEVLRIRYSPWRYNFGLRYLSYDLPSEIYQKVDHDLDTRIAYSPKLLHLCY